MSRRVISYCLVSVGDVFADGGRLGVGDALFCERAKVDDVLWIAGVSCEYGKRS